MPVRLIIDGNSVYEIDEECMEKQKKRQTERQSAAASGCMVRCQKTGTSGKTARK